MFASFIAPGEDSLSRFALDLRGLRNKAGHAFMKSLSLQTGLQTELLHAIFEGRRLPREQVLRQIVEACGGEVRGWLIRRDDLEDRLVELSMQRAIAADTARRVTAARR